MFVLIDGSEFLISAFDEPPLSQIFAATRELLTPDAKGMYVCGFTITGQPVKTMVFQHDKNAAAHGLTLGVSRSGKTQFFAINMAAQSLAGQVVWLSTVRKDEKTTVLGKYIDRQGSNALWMARQLRAAKALCEIRAEMPWPHDGQPHDYKPGDPRCPYRQLNVYADEFMTAAQDGDFGEFIQKDGEDLTVTGLKYGIGFNPAGQSPFAHNGFSTEMKDNLRQNSRPVIFNMGSPGATRKAAEGTMENPYDVPTIPARYSRSEGSAIERAMRGEADPENGVSTGGVAVIVLDNGRAVLMRSLYADFDTDLSELFPDEVNRLTDYEISELEKRGLWFDWNEPVAARRVLARARRGRRRRGPLPPARRRRRQGWWRARLQERQPPLRAGRLAPPGAGGHQEPHRSLITPLSPGPACPSAASPTRSLAKEHHHRGPVHLRRRAAGHHRRRPGQGRLRPRRLRAGLHPVRVHPRRDRPGPDHQQRPRLAHRTALQPLTTPRSTAGPGCH